MLPAPAEVPVERRVGRGLVGPCRVRPVSGVWARFSSRPVPPRRAAGRAGAVRFAAGRAGRAERVFLAGAETLAFFAVALRTTAFFRAGATAFFRATDFFRGAVLRAGAVFFRLAVFFRPAVVFRALREADEAAFRRTPLAVPLDGRRARAAPFFGRARFDPLFLVVFLAMSVVSLRVGCATGCPMLPWLTKRL